MILSAAAAFLSDAEEHYPQMRRAGKGHKSQVWSPEHRAIAVRLVEEKWKATKKISWPEDLEEPWKQIILHLLLELKTTRFDLLRTNQEVIEAWILENLQEKFQIPVLGINLGGAGFCARTPRHVLVFEAWSGQCTDSGWGPWSGGTDWRDEWEESTAPCTNEPEWLACAIAEADVRAQVIAEGKQDGPPRGAKRWVLDLWAPYADSYGDYPVMQVALWEVEEA